MTAGAVRAAKALCCLSVVLLGGCSLFEAEEVKLEGARTPVRAAAPERVIAPERAGEIASLGAPFANPDWPQPSLVPTRAPGHLAGPASLSEVWRADVGAGSDGSSRITATPVVADGRVYTLDAASGVAAVDAASGRVLWRASVTPEGENDSDGFGGGLAYMDGRLFATTGFGEVLAIAPADGAILWRQSLGAPLRAAPAVAAGRVIVVTRANQGFGLDAATGGILWRALGAPGGAGVLGGASPAVSGELAVLPFTSGELLAVRASNGRRIWSDALTGGGRGSASIDVTDISGDPVIAGQAVFAANDSGQLVAIDGRTGARGWLRQLGAASPVWPIGPTLFLVTNDARVMRLAAATGETMWSAQLPRYTDPGDRTGVIGYRGPVVAGGVVYVASSEEGLLAFDPQNGAALPGADISGGAGVAPVVAGGVLYALSNDGVLHAFR